MNLNEFCKIKRIKNHKSPNTFAYKLEIYLKNTNLQK